MVRGPKGTFLDAEVSWAVQDGSVLGRHRDGHDGGKERVGNGAFLWALKDLRRRSVTYYLRLRIRLGPM
jgi:hypothetical protein